MNRSFRVFAVVLFLPGLIFFLQGINVLPGSLMTGDPFWARNGAVLMVVGAGLFWWGSRKQA